MWGKKGFGSCGKRRQRAVSSWEEAARQRRSASAMNAKTLMRAGQDHKQTIRAPANSARRRWPNRPHQQSEQAKANLISSTSDSTCDGW